MSWLHIFNVQKNQVKSNVGKFMMNASSDLPDLKKTEKVRWSDAKQSMKQKNTFQYVHFPKFVHLTKYKIYKHNISNFNF